MVMITRSKTRKAMAATTNLTPCLSQDLIFLDILPRLPAKSLIKCSCVSKLWYNWIHDPNFIASHYKFSKSNPSLVAMCVRSDATRLMYLDHQARGERDQGGVSSPIVDLPNTYTKLLVGCINGLTCIRTRFFIEICNSSTREMLQIQIPFPKVTDCGLTSYGFGFDPVVNEYKVVRINKGICKIYTVGPGLNSTTQGCIWRDITVTSALPREWGETRYIPFLFSNGALFKVCKRNLILIFDIHYEKFQVIPGAPLRCDQSYLKCDYPNKKCFLYSMCEFQECPCAVYCTIFKEKYEFHLYALKQQHQQQQSSNSCCWLIKECSQAICIPFKPVTDLIYFVEFSGQILLLWFSRRDLLINIYNPHTRWLQKVSGLTNDSWTPTYETILFVRHIDNLHFLRTPQFKYVRSREPIHDYKSTRPSIE